MKKVFLVLAALMFIVTAAACSTATPAPANEGATTVAPAAIKPDFSKNVNVDRASDFAKTQIVLPVTGIGTTITTDVNADKEYTNVLMTKNSTNPSMPSL